MDQRERLSDGQEVIRQAVYGILANIMTAAPVRINSFDATTMTCEVTLLQIMSAEQEDNSWDWQPAVVLGQCPVIFPSGGGFTFVSPPQPGDEALAIFASRSIDEWWTQSNGLQRADLRMYHHADAFILAGIWNRTRVPAGVDPNALEIRSTDGTMKIRLDPSGITMTAPLVTINGNLILNGDAIAGTIDLKTHVHTGVQTGGGVSGPPKP